MQHSLFALGCRLFAVSLVAASCTTLPLEEEASTSPDEIPRLERQLRGAPNDPDLLRDLGALYLRAHQLEQAHGHLQRAYQHNPDDPETRFLYGLALEETGNAEEALRLYATYRDLPRRSPYRRHMAGRYRWLIRQVVREEMRARVADEEKYEQTSAQTVAVFALAYQGNADEYAVLGRALSEMVTVDLRQVRSLQVVERVRLNALLEELELAQSGAVDASTAPRLGRLLGAGRIVGGAYTVLDGDVLRVDVTSLRLDVDQVQELAPRTEDLDRFFRLEKELVFSLIDEMGVVLSPEEREAIERVPTRNLQAFLAYARGLVEEDAGRYDAAQGYYERAHTLDPDFESAAEQAEEVTAMVEVSGVVEEVVTTTTAGSPPGPSDGSDLVQFRQQNLGGTVGSLYVPGQDAREPAAEAEQAGTARLRDPPDPPRRGN